jgi:hypothetical protein
VVGLCAGLEFDKEVASHVANNMAGEEFLM